MEAVLELSKENEEILKKEVSPAIRYAETVEIKTAEDSAAAQGFIKEIKQKAKMIYAKFHPPVEAAHKAWKAAKDLENYFMKPFEDAEALIKRKVITFESAERKRRDDEQRKLQAEADERARKEQEKLKKQAEKAMEKGNVEKAEALIEKSEAVVPAPVFTPPAPALAKGTSIRKVWKGRVTHPGDLVKSILEHRAPANFIMWNQSAIDAYAKGVKDTMTIPGVEFYEEEILSSRA